MTEKKFNKRQIGSIYEKIAGAYLENHGLQIIVYNYRCKMGEIDIIARDGRYLVFCEVKYRHSDSKGHPAEAVDRKKQRVLSRCALFYLMEHRQMDMACRFDVVSIEGASIEHIRNAFLYTE